MSEIVMEVDRTSRLAYPPGTSAVIHAELRLLRPVRYILDQLEPWVFKGQSSASRLSGWDIYEHLKQDKLLVRNIGFDDQLAIERVLTPDTSPEHLRGKCFPAYAGVVEGRDGVKRLPVLMSAFFRWHILWVSLDNVFDSDFPTLLFKSRE